MNSQDAYSFILFAICIWREARGELYDTKVAQAWSVRNRVKNPRWWGHSWVGCILMPEQYSCFNHNDPNAAKWPTETDPAWQDCLQIASRVFPDPPLVPDPTYGATSYFDMSMDTDPPKWSYDGSNVKTVDLGRFHFYKLST